MRTVFIAAVMVFVGLVGQPVFERYMSGAPEWVWRAIALTLVGVGTTAAVFSDQVMPLWRSPDASRTTTVFIFTIAFGCIGAVIGLIIKPPVAKVVTTMPAPAVVEPSVAVAQPLAPVVPAEHPPTAEEIAKEVVKQIPKPRDVKPQRPLFHSHPELRLTTAFDMCGIAECNYRIELDDVATMFVADIKQGQIDFEINRGPFFSSYSPTGEVSLPLPGIPDAPPLKSITTVVPSGKGSTRSAGVLSTGLVVKGPSLGSVRFTIPFGMTHIVGVSDRKFQVTMMSFQSQPDAAGTNQYVVAFAINEQPPQK